jgi:hypothetical protein
MNDKLLKELKMESENFRLDPPLRVWNRLEYKLDRFELNKKERSRGVILYLSTVAAVFVTVVAVVFLIKSDVKEISTFERSEIIIESNFNSNNAAETYNIHKLKSYYDKKDLSKYQSRNNNLKVSTKKI